MINGKDVRPGDPIEAFTQNFPDAVQCAEGTYRVNFELTPGTGSGSDPRSLKADYENGIITRIMFDSETNQCTYDGPDLP
ncbi:MAG: hypothetical protein NT001_00355 [Candidatus Woesearchaeota archaeon]|nr:hypothetical protein [Candidatus Woesearchaeota archaeon]